MKKTILLLIITVSVFLSFGIMANAEFTDVKPEDAVLTEAVDSIVSNGIAKGISDTEFGTEDMVTREQMAAFIYRMINDGESIEERENETAFTDLDDPTFYAMISWANKEGIIKGVSETKFNPKGNITLQDCYTMVVRALGNKNLTYPDGYIIKAKEKGLSANISKEIGNSDYLTRGDVSIILHNAVTPQVYDHALDGKKILFIGNSYSYYGHLVPTRTWDVKNVKEAILDRFNDEEGGFYQLCKQNGADIYVTNWAWSGHSLKDTFSGNCQNKDRHPGYDHLADLRKYTDMYYDYVVIQPQSRVSDVAEHKNEIKYICDIFREVNPNVEFVYSICPRFYKRADELDKAFTDSIDGIADEYDLKVANWGKLIADILSGEVTVENSTQEYTYNTFIVSKSEADGYHPNTLTGYITTQMIYSLITGEDALGEDYAFYTDASLGGNFNLETVLESYYTYDNISPAESETKLTGDDLTNFPEVFASKTDMAGIQKLIDEYIKAK